MTQNKKQSFVFRGVLTLAILLTGLLSARVSLAQDKTPPVVGGGDYIFSGGLTAGYRSATITNTDGTVDTFATNRYNESFNLQKGVVLNSLNLFGEKRGTEGFFDEMYVTASGINDPVTTGSLRLRAFNSYDLKVDYRRATYFLNRNDSIFSTMHKFDFTRNFLNTSLDVYASDMVKVNVQYNMTSRDGGSVYTHNAFNDGYANVNESNINWVSIPRNDKTNDFLASITLKLPAMTSLTLGGGDRMFSQTLDATLLNDTSLAYYRPGGLPNGFSGIVGQTNLLSPSSTLFLPMTAYAYTENRDSKTPYFFLEGVSRPTDGLDITANVRYEKTTSTPSIVEQQTAGAGALVKGVAVDSLYYFGITTDGMNLTRSTLNGSLNVTGHINDDLSITGRYLYTSTQEDGSANYDYAMTRFRILSTDPAKVLPDSFMSTTTSYLVHDQQIEGFVNYAPVEMLGLKLGVRYSSITPTTVLHTPVTATPDSLPDAMLSQKMTSLTPYLDFNLRPNKDVRIDGRYAHTKNNTTNAEGADVIMPVRTVPTSIDDYSLGIQAQPINHLNTSLRYSARDGNSTFPAVTIPNGVNAVQRLIVLTDRPYKNDMHSLTAAVGYSFGKMLSFTVSGEYRANTFEIPITWGRGKSGTATLADQAFYGDSGTTPITQNTIDRALDLTVRSRPIDALHLEVGYSLLSSSGGVLAYAAVAVPWNGQPYPNNKGAYPDLTRYGGPYSSYQAHAEASYDITENVGIMADYELVYYKEDKVGDYYALNDYKASLLRGGFSLKF